MAESQPIPVRSERQWIIYVLIDPRTKEVRYVGVTTRKLNWRLNEHISRAQKGGKLYRDNWIRQVLADGHRPKLLPLETVGTDWVQAEQYWISFYREAGARLTNLSAGGEGSTGYVPTPELRAKWSAMRRGKKYAPGRRSGMLGKQHSESARQLIAAASAARGHTPESRRKLSEAHKGKVLSPEHIEKMAAAKRGRKLSEAHKRKIQASISHCKPVRCVSTGEVFPSTKAAARFLGVKPTYILQALRKGCRCSGSYWEYVNG